MSTQWSFILADPSGTELEAVQAISRRATWRLDDPADASAVLDLTDEAATKALPHAADLIAQRNGVDLYRGKLGDPSINLGSDAQIMGVNSLDYRGLITKAAKLPAETTITNTDQADIAWDMIDAYQNRPGGDRGITRGVGQTSGKLRDRTYERGAPIGELITKLGRVRDGYDWEIDAALAFNMWHASAGGRGLDNVATLDYGAAIATATRSPASQPFGNAWEVTGGDGTTPSGAVAADILTDPRGRWEQFAAFNEISEQPTLDDRAAYMLDQGTGRRRWTLGLSLGWWEGPDDLWLGDTFTLSIDAPNTEVEALYRVIEISLTLGESDTDEQITLGVLEVAT